MFFSKRKEKKREKENKPGSGPLGAVWHVDWFGQPAQADANPASFDSVPGQSCGACSVILISKQKKRERQEITEKDQEKEKEKTEKTEKTEKEEEKDNNFFGSVFLQK